MKTKRKVIVYVDGSYREGTGGWCFMFLCNNKFTNSIVGYGNCEANSSSQVEIISCIKALEKIKLQGIEQMEIRTDCINIVDVMNQKQYENWEKKNWTNLTGRLVLNNITEWHKLISLINESGYNIVFKKSDRKDGFGKFVDKYARIGLYTKNVDKNSFFLKEIHSSNFVEVSKQYIEAKIEPITLKQKSKKKRIWYKDQETIELPIEDILLVEDIHLRTRTLNLHGMLKGVNRKNKVFLPIAVRKLDSDKYALVAGLSRYCAAKIIGINTIPAVITELSHSQFIDEYGIQEIEEDDDSERNVIII